MKKNTPYVHNLQNTWNPHISTVNAYEKKEDQNQGVVSLHVSIESDHVTMSRWSNSTDPAVVMKGQLLDLKRSFSLWDILLFFRQTQTFCLQHYDKCRHSF